MKRGPTIPKRFCATRTKRAALLLRCLAVAGFAAANVMLLSVSIWAGVGDMGDGTRTLFHWISGLIAIPAALYAGRPFYRSALKSLAAGHANMDVPISLAILLALALSVYQIAIHGENAYFDAAVTLPFLLADRALSRPHAAPPGALGRARSGRHAGGGGHAGSMPMACACA